MAGEKTEKATHKRRQDERKKGNVFTSKDIVSVTSLLAVFFTLQLWFPHLYTSLKTFFLDLFDNAATTTEISTTFLSNLWIRGLLAFFQAVLPILLVGGLVSVIATIAQTGFLFVTDSLKPKFERLSPVKGIKKLFSLRSLIEVFKGLLKIVIIFYIVYKFYVDRLGQIAKTMHLSTYQSTLFLLESVMDLIVNVSIIFVAVSVLDYFYQRWEYERQIKMSKHEIKEEYKQTEGDPKIKAKIKEKQRSMAMSRMMQAVPSADVIIRNPTHFAVALRYDTKRDTAPVVIAKGQDEMALRIVAAGEEHDVYIMENKPLARAIYAQAEVNQEIPMEYYGAVAEILIFVYQLKHKDIFANKG